MEACDDLSRQGHEIFGFNWVEHVARCKAEPGRWALVAVFQSAGAAGYARSRCLAQLAKAQQGTWQVTARRRPASDRYGLYCRFIRP